MNLYGGLMDQLLSSGAFAGLNSPKPVERGIPEGMKPGPRSGGRYMNQATQLSGVHPQSPPPSAPLPDLPGLGAGSEAPYVDEPGAVMPPPVAGPSQMPLASMHELLSDGRLGSLGSGIVGQLGAEPQPQPAQQPRPQPAPQPLPPEFLRYGRPFMGLNGFMF